MSAAEDINSIVTILQLNPNLKDVSLTSCPGRWGTDPENSLVLLLLQTLLRQQDPESLGFETF